MPPLPLLGRRIGLVLAAGLFPGFAHPASSGAETPPEPSPKVNPGAVYPELKLYDSQGSPLRVPKEDWAGAARRASTDPSWAKWVEGKEKEVDGWSAKRHDQVEWVAGWFHDFVSPKDASELKFTYDEPGPETLGSASDPKVPLTPKLHAAWVYFFRSKHIGEVLQAARLYRLTGKTRYAAWAASQIDFYADNYEKWPAGYTDNYFPQPPKVKYVTSRIMYQPLDEAAVLIELVDTARILADYVTPDRRQHWIDALFQPEAALLVRSAINRVNNRSCWEFSAVGDIALYCHDDALWQRAVSGPFGIHEQIARGVTSDYLWYEQSLHYNAYTVSGLSSVFRMALMTGHGADLREDMETVENLMLTPAEMRFPTGQLPNPADGGKAERAPDDRLWSDMAPIFPTAIGVYELAQQKTWIALLDPPDGADVAGADPKRLKRFGAKPVLPAVISRSFPGSGMAVIRQGNWQVYLHYGQLTSSHAQAEALNFEAFFGNTDVSQDPGTVGYGSPMTKDYYRAAICHNVPLVDGVGQVSWSPGQLDSFSAASVSASQPRYQPKAAASRTLAIDGDLLQDTLQIATADGKDHTLGFLLHLTGKVASLPASFMAEPDPKVIQPAVPGFKYWKNTARAAFHDQAEFDVRFGAQTMRVHFDLPGDFTLWHASAPDLLPIRREVFYLETHGQTAVLKTAIRPAAN